MADATRRALSTDPQIQAALSRVRGAAAEAEQARLLPNPILSVSVRYPTSGGKPTIEAALAADLISLLQRSRGASAADNRLRLASAEALTVVLDVLAEVQERYAGVQALDAQMNVLDERRKLIKRLLDLAQSRLRAGEGTRLDVATLDAQRVELEIEIADRRLERTQERLTLARLIGQPSATPDWQLSGWQPPPVVTTDERAWVSTAIESRPEAQAGRWELVALGDEFALTRLAPWDGTAIGPHAERDADWTVGPEISVPLPLFDWGQAKRAKARAAVIEARHRLTQTRRQIVEETRKAYAAFTATYTTLQQVESELVPLQERRREQAEAAYRAGETGLITLLLAEQDLQQSKAKLVELQQRASVALVKLQRAVGGPGIAVDSQNAPTTAPTSQPATTTQGGQAVP